VLAVDRAVSAVGQPWGLQLYWHSKQHYSLHESQSVSSPGFKSSLVLLCSCITARCKSQSVYTDPDDRSPFEQTLAHKIFSCLQSFSSSSRRKPLSHLIL